MQNWFAKSILIKSILILMFAVQGTHVAQAAVSTQELKTIYASYKTAIDSGDYKQAYVIAQDVWEASETSLGASKQTGDFAYNYAVLGKAFTGVSRHKTVEKAFERSLELVNLHGTKANEISLQRQVDFALYWTQINKRKKAEALLASAEKLAQSAGLTHSKPYALLMSEKSGMVYKKKKHQNAETYAQTALDIYETLNLSNTKGAYEAIYKRALAQVKLKKWRPAMLGFETIYTNMDGVLKPTNALVGKAFLQSSTPKREYVKENDTDYTDLADVLSCFGCWPNFDIKHRPNLKKGHGFRYKRVAPQMPPGALASGFVVLMYDVDEKGTPENVRIVQASHRKMFDKASVYALQQWKITQSDTGKTVTNMKDLVTQMTFMLTGRRGQLLDFYGREIEK
ncbi:MAG: energy transducer TonB [Robiginitomaculum sp.]|nr:energy transducer TonB [Robiginitomaculum sp.]